jgi:signal transduction histidine kinase
MRFSNLLKVVTTCVLACSFGYVSAFSTVPFLLQDTSITYRLDGNVHVFIDSGKSATINDVIKPEFQVQFLSHAGNLTFGYLKPTIWLKVNMHAASPGTEWFLEIPAPFLEYVDFYQLRGDSSWQHASSGYFRRQSEKQFSHTGHLLPLQRTSDANYTVYIKIAGISPKTFPLYAIEKTRFIEKTRLEDIGYGIFFGILIVMFFYNLYIYLTLRQINYLLYACIIACSFLIFMAISGYGGKFLWPEYPTLNYFTGKLVIEALIVFLTLYTIKFLEIKQYSKFIYYILWSLIPLAVIAVVLVSTDIVSSAGNNLIRLSTLVYMTAGVVVTLKGNKAGSYFIAAWTFYFIGGQLVSLRNGGVLDYNFWTTHFVEIGAILGTTIMCFGLGAQYRRLKDEKEEAQLLALEVQQEATVKLETKVNERTKQLYQTNKKLKRTLQTNKKQTHIIESKNAELDTFFHRISHDLKGPISSSLGLMVLAKMDVKDKVALDYIDKQLLQMERLSHIIKGLVNLTTLNNAQLGLEKIDFDRMIDDCISSFNTVTHFSKLAFEKHIPHDLTFYSEWTLLNAILQNLIENAIKYCRGESPFVKIRVKEEPGGVLIEVEDNGVGIPIEHQEKIFQMFYRATQEAEGSGLGLYILKRSVDRLNGTIGIKSEVDVGTTFMVRLPHLKVDDMVSVDR